METSCILPVANPGMLQVYLMPSYDGTLNRLRYVTCVGLESHCSSLIFRQDQTSWVRYSRGRKQKNAWKRNCLVVFMGCMIPFPRASHPNVSLSLVSILAV